MSCRTQALVLADFSGFSRLCPSWGGWEWLLRAWWELGYLQGMNEACGIGGGPCHRAGCSVPSHLHIFSSDLPIPSTLPVAPDVSSPRQRAMGHHPPRGQKPWTILSRFSAPFSAPLTLGMGGPGPHTGWVRPGCGGPSNVTSPFP